MTDIIRTERSVQRCACVSSLCLHWSQTALPQGPRGPPARTGLDTCRQERGVRTRKMVWRSLSSGGRFVSRVHYESYPSKALLVSLSRKWFFLCVWVYLYTLHRVSFLKWVCTVILFFSVPLQTWASLKSLFEGEKIVGPSGMGSLNFSLFFLTFFITT